MNEIIDFHAHIFPDKIAGKATVSIGNFYGYPMRRHGSLDMLLEFGKKSGVTRFAVQSVATVPGQVRPINEFIAQSAKNHSEIIGLGAMHPDLEDIPGEVRRIREAGLRGIKLHPDFQKFNIDSPEAMRIYSEIEGVLPLLIHTGDFRYDYSHPKRLANVLDKFPDLDVVAAHFGGWSVWDEAEKYLLPRRCMVDTSSTFNYIEDKEKWREMVNKWGADRLIFGTDFPMADYSEELERFYYAAQDLSPEELEKVMNFNAKFILNL